MASYHAMEMKQDALNSAVAEQISKYSLSLRNRLGNITDY